MTSEEGSLSDGVRNLETCGEQGVSSLIKIDRSKILGAGSCGIVFDGTWNGKKVAVKRVQIANTESSKPEEEALQKLDHPNVIKLFHVQSDEDFRFYALELCQASLNHLFLKEDDTKKYRGPMPSEKEVFLQLATGLAHIHETGLIHRDLKPQNVLIHVDNGEKVQLKWADFGLSKPVNENGSCSMSGINRGTDSWYAPEILKITAEQDEGKLEKKKEKKEKKEKNKNKDTENNSEEKDAKKEKKEKKEKKKDKKEEKGVNDVGVISSRLRATVKSDVFGEGLIFGYFLLGGVHPYGSKSHEITSHILNDKPVHLKEIKKQQQPYHDIIMEMLKNNPDERISSSEVVSRITNI